MCVDERWAGRELEGRERFEGPKVEDLYKRIGVRSGLSTSRMNTPLWEALS